MTPRAYRVTVKKRRYLKHDFVDTGVMMNLKYRYIPRLFAIIALILLIYFPQKSNAQSFIFPLDNGGYAAVKFDHNTLYVFGIVIGDQVPNWSDLVLWEGPACAIFNVYFWSCGNPPRNGRISTGFSYRLTIIFPKGCKGRGCFSIINHPEFGQICIDDDTGNIAICVDILDVCGNPVRYRDHTAYPFVDMEELVIFRAELTSPNENAVFPQYLSGEADGSGLPYENIQMIQTDHGPGFAEYQSDAYTVGTFFTVSREGELLFSISGAPEYFENIWAEEVKFTVEDHLNFVDDIELDSHPMENTVCYPGNSFLSFGVDVKINPLGWPYPCDVYNVAIKGFKDAEQIITTSGQAIAGGFSTEPAQSSYQTDGSYRIENFNLSWMASVNGGPDREAQPISTQVHLHHGFMARDMIVANPPSGDTMRCGDLLDVTASPVPDLTRQARIKYCWDIIPPEGPPQVYGTFLGGDCAEERDNTFRADWPGDIQIRYRIWDV